VNAPEAVTPVTLWRGDHYEGDSFFLSESKHQRREEWKALPVDAYAALVAERDALAQYHGGHLPTCGGMDTANRTCGCGYLDGEAYRSVIDENAALRTLLKDARSDLLIGTKASGWVLVQRIDTALGAERSA
jgi:hypothetical protein